MENIYLADDSQIDSDPILSVKLPCCLLENNNLVVVGVWKIAYFKKRALE